MLTNKAIYKAAIYLRISRDDDDKAESDSINNQRELLKAYVAKDPEVEIVKEFVDDGFTGTNFERPGFQEMMDMVQEKKIDCIIVKDLSRLGRNYIETGRFIDQIFPLLKVRFISVNDNYDSFSDHNEADEILVPFKNLINDAYCRDISMKVRSQLDVKRKAGKFTGAFAPCGYKKDPKDKTRLIVDEKAANIVKMIFDMKLEGYSQTRIAKKLNEMGVLTPQQYKKSMGLKCNGGNWKTENPHWVAPAITRILTNEVYLGTMVQGRYRKVNYKIKKIKPVDEKEWIRVEGTHEPLITKATFDVVQEVLQMDTRTSPNKETVELLAGLVKCSECGENMTLCNRYKGGKKYRYYVCSSVRNGYDCDSHPINADKLERIISRMVKKQIDFLLNTEEMMQSVDGKLSESRRAKVLSEQIETLDSEIAKYQQMKERLYIDYQDKVIDSEDYEDLKRKFTDNLEESNHARNLLIEQRDAAMKDPVLPNEWIDEVCKSCSDEKISRKTVLMLIEEIIVFENNRVEVMFRFGDEMKALADYLGKDYRFMRRRAYV